MTRSKLFTDDSIHVDVVSVSQPSSSVSVLFCFAKEKPVLGDPGKEPGEMVFIQSSENQSMLKISVGLEKKASLENFRQAGGALSKWIRKNPAKDVDLDIQSLESLGFSGSLAAALEGILLGYYQFNQYKTGSDESRKAALHLRTSQEQKNYSSLLEKVQVICRAVNLSRTWAHEPANIINPVTLAERARLLAKEFGLKCIVLDDKDLKEMTAGAILAVGQGSKTPSRMIILEHEGTTGKKGSKPVVLVGKAITFDTGGYSIKDRTSIVSMKYDKSAGITVAATMMALAALKYDQPVIGIIAAAENMISSEAYRPDDIITTLSGKTVEIITTDAEGRLVLADALTYAQKHYQPLEIIDLATLTGGVVTALGKVRAGILSNNDQLVQDLVAAGDRTYERLWRLPLDEEYFKNIKGDEADLKNSGGRDAHCTMGGIFLKQFVDDSVPWAHLDIAGMADTEKDLPYCAKGATGFGVRLLMDYLSTK